MATRMSEAVQYVRRAMLQHDGAGLTDGQLLARFVEQHEDAAVATLVRRHGPMVWGVCRRILDNHHDAEDAFQATFLVLVRRAREIMPREMVGNWLYGVAHQTALKARAMLAKRRTREKAMAALPEISAASHQHRHELQLALDHELSRLPNKYRVAIVLCDLEGRSRSEAARQLGVPSGTLKSQLTRGRALLAKRLTRRGLALSGGMLAVALAEQTASAGGPASVIATTIKAVTAVAAGQAASMGAISVQAAALAEGMVKTMMMSKVKLIIGMLLVLTATTAGGLVYSIRAQDAPRGESNQDELRAAALKVLERYGKSDQANDREAAIQALVDLRREIKAAEEARRGDSTRAVHGLAERFVYRVPIELGETEFKEGGRLDIVEIWGTRPRIEIGGQYLVRGKYKLPPGQRGRIYFYATAGGAWGAIGTTLDLQSIAVDKQEGEFTLVHGMLGEGNFHLVLADPERYSRMFANVYFGTGDNVLKKKSR
jgi:RNA polymerase sigma factor (sigma-70 family)